MPATSLEIPDQDLTSLPLAKAKVTLLPRKALPFYGRHPWVLSSAVQKVEARWRQKAQGGETRRRSRRSLQREAQIHRPRLLQQPEPHPRPPVHVVGR